ncbi:MAG: Smr/MutS family protein [Sulfuricellaceae bacterium]
MIGKRLRRAKSAPPLSEEEIALFRKAVADVRPLRALNRVRPTPPLPWPEPRPASLDAQAVAVDNLSDNIPWYDLLDNGDELVFRRPGLTHQILKNLRRGHWKIQSEIDLHGHTSEEARQQLVRFLNECRHHGLRCVRVIHGKGLCSKNREPVLKIKTANWLMQREDVLAFCQAKPNDGGAGALIVLLKAAGRMA